MRARRYRSKPCKLAGPRAGEVMIEIKVTGICHTDELIMHILPLERFNEGFDLMHAGTSIRAVVAY